MPWPISSLATHPPTLWHLARAPTRPPARPPLYCRRGRSQECQALLPAVATLLQASPQEYRVLRDNLQRQVSAGSWLGRVAALA